VIIDDAFVNVSSAMDLAAGEAGMRTVAHGFTRGKEMRFDL
jgi:hypothetical protein